MYIETEQYSDPNKMTFLPHHMLHDGDAITFKSKEQATHLPLAASLFELPGVEFIKIGPDFILVTKSDDTEWADLKPKSIEAITNSLAPLLPKDDEVQSGGQELYLLAEAIGLGGLFLS